MSSPELDHVRGVWERMQGNSPIYGRRKTANFIPRADSRTDFLLSDALIVKASRGAVTARLTLGNNHVNSRGTLHGAVSASLVDWGGSLAIASQVEQTGASIDIQISYIGTANVGETIEIEAVANKVGRSVAFTTIRIYKVVNEVPGPMIATGSHTKFLSQPKEPQ